MKTEDEHSIRKAEIEDRAIHAAEDAAQVAAFGKSCYEGYCAAWPPDMVSISEKWSNLSDNAQCAWVKAAQAGLAEAQRVGWMFPV